jgi:predicted ATP-grasp superfamily ATP-dependent carboligase
VSGITGSGVRHREMAAAAISGPMHILVHECASGGGFSGRHVPPSLAREGAAMRAALVSDLSVIGHRVVTTADPRFPFKAPPGVEVVTMAPRSAAQLDRLLASVELAWLVAPETNGCLERLAERAEQNGTALIGCGAAAIRRASDKARLPGTLRAHGVSHPDTRVVIPRGNDARQWNAAAREIGYPVVVKPARGAGCGGVCFARNPRELPEAIETARRTTRGPLLVQQYVRGVAASVSLVADGCRAVALAVNAQAVRRSRRFAYSGGRTPLQHPLAARAVDAALRTCEILPGLRGYVGVDLVLTGSDAVVIEVNPRLTTAYLGVRSSLRCGGIDGNVAALALAACAGALPAPPPVSRSVRFTASGRIVESRSAVVTTS